MKENRSNKKKQLELYLHIPFCVQKCQYCDFLSAPADYSLREAYVQALIQEICQKAPDYADYSVPTIFIGGGTPSILDGGQMTELMEAVFSHFQVMENAEITVECNPGTLTAGKLFAYRRAQINRLSMGLQSARAEELRMLGRIHTFDDFLTNYDMARKAGFDNINVDLMSGLPGQTSMDWEITLSEVLRLRPEHISAYSLIIEEGTPFYEKYEEDEQRREAGEEPLYLPDEAAERRMYEMTGQILKEKGYVPYEISNYARPGRECRHNIGYWRRENYLGLGLGSASLVENVRFSNTRNLSGYLKGQWEPEEVEVLSRREQMEEFMFLGLRMTRGISRNSFRETFGIEIEGVYGTVLSRMYQQKLLKQESGRIFLTKSGVSVSNYVMSQFLLG